MRNDESGDNSRDDASEVKTYPREIVFPTDARVIETFEILETDGGGEPVKMQSARDLGTVGSHIIFRAVGSLVKRPSNPNYFRNEEWRFLQHFMAKCPGDKVRLTIREARLLTSIYYLSMKNSICGAFPPPLFPPPSFTKRFNFADIISHIRSRLKNLSLLTSCDPRVIQFYFDGLLNFQFQDVHSRFVLS